MGRIEPLSVGLGVEAAPLLFSGQGGTVPWNCTVPGTKQSRMGVFNKIFSELASKGGKPARIMIDATHLKAHRTAASLLKKGLFPDISVVPKAA